MNEVDQCVHRLYQREVDWREREIAIYSGGSTRIVETRGNAFVDVTDDWVSTLISECLHFKARIELIQGVRV